MIAAFRAIIIISVYTALAEEPEECSTKDAEPCLASRQRNYAKVMESHFGGNANTNGQFEEMGAQMCL